MSDKTIVLAFSGGLDTSFCVPWLIEKGYRVVTLFVDTGGVDADERAWIERRARELGAVRHVTADAADEIWSDVVVPMIRGGRWYQDQYPLLCSDRYVVVKRAVALCRETGADSIAHGCTGMGNDQVRFDLAIRTLADLEIVAPVRDLQEITDRPRDYERDYLESRDFEVRAKTAQYTINENLLGVTVSGSEIDEWAIPGDGSYQITAPPRDWPREPTRATVAFEAGVPVALDGERMGGPALLARLNEQFGRYGVGRGIYTGDTVVGLKGRIVYEAPGLTTLNAAHRALEETTLTRQQNHFKPGIARQWVELVYSGLFFDPLRKDLEAFLAENQRSVTGAVTLESSGGLVHAVAIDSDRKLTAAGAVYAQQADWTAEQARGFIRLYGQSSELWARVNRDGSET